MVLTDTAPRLLSALRHRGITVVAVGGRLKVTPASALRDADRAAIKRHRHALLVELVNPPLDSGLCPWCHTRPSLCAPYGACGVCVDELRSKARRLGPGRAEAAL